jgi:hypothetical protein
VPIIFFRSSVNSPEDGIPVSLGVKTRPKYGSCAQNMHNYVLRSCTDYTEYGEGRSYYTPSFHAVSIRIIVKLRTWSTLLMMCCCKQALLRQRRDLHDLAPRALANSFCIICLRRLPLSAQQAAFRILLKYESGECLKRNNSAMWGA